MAVNNIPQDDGLARDPRLARLLDAAGGAEPPAALDAAILAAARREVGARPQAAGGGEAAAPPPRAAHVKRNWYVPVSIAAVLVLSVSLVTLVHQEKGDELAQPPAATAPLPKTRAPAPGVAPEAVADKPDTALRDAAPAQPRIAEAKRVDAAKTTAVPAGPVAQAAPAAPEAYAGLAKKQLARQAPSAADGAPVLGDSRQDQAAGAARERASVSESAAAAKPATGGVSGSVAAGAPPPLMRDAKPAPEPFPAAGVIRRDDALARGEADLIAARGAAQEPPAIAAAPVAPQAKVQAAPRRAAPFDEAASSAPAAVESRAMAVPPPAKMAPPPAPKPALKPALKPVPPWRGLEDQPPEKWLERLADLRRDNRQADTDELLAEFRRRFPDHPASGR